MWGKTDLKNRPSVWRRARAACSFSSPQFSHRKPSLAVVHFPTRSCFTVASATSPLSFYSASSRLCVVTVSFRSCLPLLLSVCPLDILWDSRTLLTKLSSLIPLHSPLCSMQPCSQVSCFVACMKCVHCSVRERGSAWVCACTSHGIVVVLLVIVLCDHSYTHINCCCSLKCVIYSH